jgi:uncharacterized Zn-binding protein involved in type VI secretion
MSGKPAARLGDPTACPLPGHGTNPIAAGSPDVMFDSLPAARQGDPSACGGAMAGNVISNVLINGMPAATVGTVGGHGNVVMSGSGTVVIGTTHSPAQFLPPLPIPGGFDEQFVLTDEVGVPLKNHHYLLVRANGSHEIGITDSSGLTHRVGRHTHSEEIHVYVSQAE